MNLKIFAWNLLIAIILLTWGSPIFAWESDMHFGLTRWLALQAGFTDDAAEKIAFGNLSLDEGILAAPMMVGAFACQGDQGASLEVRDNHFPTFVEVPAAPRTREVKPGSKAALNRARLEASRKIDSTYSNEQQSSLTSFGQGLHTLQDSWSHQGIPEVPPVICDKNYAWGHPKNRGGWRSHGADLTYLWKTDTLNSSAATYELMIEYLKSNSWAKSLSKTPVTLSSLKQNIMQFAILGTKSGKQDWFLSNSFTNADFLEGTSIPDGQRRFQFSPVKNIFIKSPRRVAREIAPPNEVRTFFQKFITDWLTTNDSKILLDQVDTAKLSKEIKSSAAKIDVARTVLLSWKVKDHGLVSQLGHASADTSADNFQKLIGITKNSQNLINYNSLEDGVIPFGEDAFLLDRDGANKYVAFVKVKNAPHDTVIIEIEKVNGKWIVISVDSMVDD